MNTYKYFTESTQKKTFLVFLIWPCQKSREFVMRKFSITWPQKISEMNCTLSKQTFSWKTNGFSEQKKFSILSEGFNYALPIMLCCKKSLFCYRRCLLYIICPQRERQDVAIWKWLLSQNVNEKNTWAVCKTFEPFKELIRATNNALKNWFFNVDKKIRKWRKVRSWAKGGGVEVGCGSGWWGA